MIADTTVSTSRDSRFVYVWCDRCQDYIYQFQGERSLAEIIGCAETHACDPPPENVDFLTIKDPTNKETPQ